MALICGMLSAIWLTIASTAVAAIAPIGTSVRVETNSPIAPSAGEHRA